MTASDDNLYETLPDPSRVAEGLRDTGYLFPTAVADIVDNSIAAEATAIEVIANMDITGEIMLAVLDNGYGMDKDGIINALRYGSSKRPNRASLGKFGLGLKTSSTAFCRRLSVVTRDTGMQPLKGTWDLDRIADIGWKIEISTPSKEELALLDRVAAGKPGTVVLWEKVDRLVGEKGNEKKARKALDRYIDQLKDHCAMVYQRYIDLEDTRARNISLKINGSRLDPWDPFCLSETKKPAAELLQKVQVPGGEQATFTVRAYILPRKDEFADPLLAKKAKLSNDYQGIYVYRENRMIHGPDWMDMFRKEPHFTLLRVEFSFDHKLDEAFHIDIKKSQIILNEVIYDLLRDKFLAPPRREAEKRYRHGAAAAAKGAAALLHAASNNAIHAKADSLKTANIEGVDGKSGNVTISNKFGSATLKIKLLESTEAGELHVQPADSLNDGILWEPALIDRNQAVRINTSHAYYSKVYLPNRKSGVTVQGLDSLLWALCAAEMGTVSDSTKRHFEELRFEVSRLLRQLVEDMPEPDLGGNGND
ncbi:ATP-binding protein [Geomonas paludis]|uniref:ATP-binding protein n=1 Tax=Geomonas paludis TaxID=2740185 RepID=A0ABY4LBB3_9BACT|nr:ATP-binding protein [Geomonas paludis]UPU35268.1 ATP-binding protein [Geomonas paludis]